MFGGEDGMHGHRQVQRQNDLAFSDNNWEELQLVINPGVAVTFCIC